MPSEEFKAVTVICKDSCIADMLSTSLFVMPVSDGKKLAEDYGAEAVWYHKNGDIDKTSGYEDYLTD